MAEPKTRPTGASVPEFLAAVSDETRRTDALALVRILGEATGAEPTLWGTNIVGFGSRPIVYADGKALDWPQIAFTPRKQHLTLYLNGGFERLEPLLERFGKHSHGKGCLHFKRLAEIDSEVLREIIRLSLEVETG